MRRLEELIKVRHPMKAILDGIVDPEIFEKMDTKILWILKETNGNGPAANTRMVVVKYIFM